METFYSKSSARRHMVEQHSIDLPETAVVMFSEADTDDGDEGDQQRAATATPATATATPATATATPATATRATTRAPAASTITVTATVRQPPRRAPKDVVPGPPVNQPRAGKAPAYHVKKVVVPVVRPMPPRGNVEAKERGGRRVWHDDPAFLSPLPQRSPKPTKANRAAKKVLQQAHKMAAQRAARSTTPARPTAAPARAGASVTDEGDDIPTLTDVEKKRLAGIRKAMEEGFAAEPPTGRFSPSLPTFLRTPERPTAQRPATATTSTGRGRGRGTTTTSATSTRAAKKKTTATKKKSSGGWGSGAGFKSAEFVTTSEESDDDDDVPAPKKPRRQ